mmetsp:Transcript_4971/g.21474  ORF Transcript_4971/g.21474 Transcript_4971/m.21474 type:complete len:545 (+) Transcript_4971:2584-4218(+)
MEDILAQMLDKGIKPGTITIAVVAEACVEKRRLDVLERLFEKLRTAGAKPDAMAYAHAIAGFCKADDTEAADKFVELMREDKVEPITHVVNALMHPALSDNETAKAIMDDLSKNGVDPSVTFMLLVDRYASAGDLPRLLHLIETWKKSDLRIDLYPYLAAMNLLTKTSKIKLARGLYADVKQQRLKPSLALINSYVEILCQGGALEEAARTVEEDVHEGNEEVVMSYNILISHFLRLRYLTEAQETLKRLETRSRPNVVTYNTFISSFAKQGEMDSAVSTFQEMKRRQIEPSVVSYSVLIVGFAKRMQFDKALEFFEEMLSASIQPDSIVYSAMIDVFAKTGNLARSESIYREMREKKEKQSLVAYNSMINAYAKARQIPQALAVLTDIAEDKLKPNVVSHNIIVSAYARAGDVENALLCFDAMKSKGLQPNSFTYNSIIDAYGKAHDLEGAIEMFEEMSEENVPVDIVTYNTLMSAANRVEDFEMAVNIYESLRASKQVKADRITFDLAQDAFQKLGDSEKARKAARAKSRLRNARGSRRMRD